MSVAFRLGLGVLGELVKQLRWGSDPHILGVFESPVYALIAGEQPVCAAVPGEGYEVIIRGIIHDGGRDVLWIRDDLGEMCQLVGELLRIGDTEPTAEPLVTGTLHEPLQQMRRNDQRGASYDRAHGSIARSPGRDHRGQQHVGVYDDPQR